MQTQEQEMVKSQLYNRRLKEEIEKEDKELEELEKAMQEPSPQEEKPEEPAPDASAEEKTFAKRYADLRRHMAQKEKEFQTKLEALTSEKDSLQKVVTEQTLALPKSKEDIEKWRSEYPDVYSIVRTIAAMEAEDRNQTLIKKMSEIEEKEQRLTKIEAEKELLKLHSDALELKNSEDFHIWASEQSDEIQSWLYNTLDWKKAARAIDLYKFDKDFVTAKKQQKAEASKTVDKKTAQEPKEKQAKIWKRSEIEKLSAKKFEELEDELNKAFLEGRINNAE